MPGGGRGVLGPRHSRSCEGTPMIRLAAPPRRSRIALLPDALQPFSRRIPLLVTALLCAAIGGMLWLSRNRVHGVVVEAELGRLQASSHQLATALQSSARRLQREGVRMATSPALVRVLGASPSAADRRAAQTELSGERARSPQISSIAVWDLRHRLVLV